MPGVAVVGDAGGIPELADDGYARHGVDESHDIQGWAILLINTIILSLVSGSFCFHCCRADLSVVGILGRRLEVARCGRRRHEAAVEATPTIHISVLYSNHIV